MVIMHIAISATALYNVILRNLVIVFVFFVRKSTQFISNKQENRKKRKYAIP